MKLKSIAFAAGILILLSNISAVGYVLYKKNCGTQQNPILYPYSWAISPPSKVEICYPSDWGGSKVNRLDTAVTNWNNKWKTDCNNNNICLIRGTCTGYPNTHIKIYEVESIPGGGAGRTIINTVCDNPNQRAKITKPVTIEVDDGYTGTDILIELLEHELGHALGIDHSDQPADDARMNENWSNASGIMSDDWNAMNHTKTYEEYCQ